MKTPRTPFRPNPRNQFVIGSLAAVCALALAIGVAKSDDLPGLSLQLGVSNQLQLTITNGVATNNYEIYRRIAIDPLYPWALHQMGTNGQTNFTATMGIDTVGFFQARAGSDADGDGVPNSQDADPHDAAVGILTISIDSPANGSTIQ